MPKKQSTAAQRARQAARETGVKYTQALRESSAASDRWGGHEFAYESHTDLFKCVECGVYEVVARSGEGPIKPCPGPDMGDGERVYLLVTRAATYYRDRSAQTLAWHLRGASALGRIVYAKGVHDTSLSLVETTTASVDELHELIGVWTVTDTSPLGERTVPLARQITRLTEAEGRAHLAEHRAAFNAMYGEPAS